MKINPQFTLDKVRFDQPTDAHLVLSIEAPKSDWQAKRQPICVIPVLDISGSMRGEKMTYAKRSLLKMVEHLTSEDYLGLVSFSDSVYVDLAPEKMTPEIKEKARSVIGKYDVRGGTNFSSGLLKGLEVANSLDLPATTLVRVIVFTDGQPTHGITDPVGLSDLLEKCMGRSTVSAFGYGRDANQELLSGLSTKGKGNYAFVQDPDSALSAFGKELGGLLSTYAQDLVVEFAPSHGHQILKILSDADVEEETTGEVRVKLPQILSEETVNLVASVKISEQKQAGPRPVTAIDVKITYQTITAEGVFKTETEDAKARIQFVKAGEEQTKPTPSVDGIVALAQLVEAQVAAEAAAQRGEYKTAGEIFRGLNLESRGHEKLGAMADHVGMMYTSNASYTASGGNRIGLRRAMSRGSTTSGVSRGDEALLRSCNLISENQAQVDTRALFEVPPEPAPVPNPVLDPLGVANGGGATPVEPPASPLQGASKSRSYRW